MRLERRCTAEHLGQLRGYLKARPEGRRTRAKEYVGYLLFATILSMGLCAVLFVELTLSPWWFAVTPLVALAFWHPLWRSLDARTQEHFVANNKAELGSQEFWIDDAGFGNKTPAGNTYHLWSAIFEVRETAELGFVSARGRLYAIPKDVRPDEVSSFMQELRVRWERAGAVEQGVEADEAR